MQIETNFDFHEWAFLAQVSPDEFETRRKNAIECFLSESSDRQRGLGLLLQREIDVERESARNPQAAFSAIASMMCMQLAFLGEELTNLRDDMKLLVRDRMPSNPGLSAPI